MSVAPSSSAAAWGRLHEDRDSERSERALVERLAAPEIGHFEAHVIQHSLLLAADCSSRLMDVKAHCRRGGRETLVVAVEATQLGAEADGRGEMESVERTELGRREIRCVLERGIIER